MESVDPAVLESISARSPRTNRRVLESTLSLAREIVRHKREGHAVGALFTIGDAARVLERSQALILDPLCGHAPDNTRIWDARLRGTLKELAQLDGAFVITDDGVVMAACRYLDAPATGVQVPLGLGIRHVAAASISKHLGIIAIAVSQSGSVRVFCDGDLVADIAL